MLKIVIPEVELFDEETSEFSKLDEVVLELEHSLVSLSKWESKFEKPFLGAGEKTKQEIFDYIEAMIVTPDFPPGVVSRLSNDKLDIINDYINRSQTATWFNNVPQGRSTEVITSELIYYWMTINRVSIECENWPLNRLLTLLRIFNTKNMKMTPKNRASQLEQRRALNEQRRRQYQTTG